MKSLFLKHVVSEVGLDHIQVVQERAERFGNQDFDVVLARGVAPLETLWELSASTKSEYLPLRAISSS